MARGCDGEADGRSAGAGMGAAGAIEAGRLSGAPSSVQDGLVGAGRRIRYGSILGDRGLEDSVGVGAARHRDPA